MDSQGPGNCVCNGFLQNKSPVHVSTGTVSVNSDSFQSVIMLNLFRDDDVFCSGTYWLYLDSSVFYGKLVKITFAPDELQAVVDLTMVQRA